MPSAPPARSCWDAVAGLLLRVAGRPQEFREWKAKCGNPCRNRRFAEMHHHFPRGTATDANLDRGFVYRFLVREVGSRKGADINRRWLKRKHRVGSILTDECQHLDKAH